MDDSILAERILEDGRRCQVILLTYARARLCIGPNNVFFYDDTF